MPIEAVMQKDPQPDMAEKTFSRANGADALSRRRPIFAESRLRPERIAQLGVVFEQITLRAAAALSELLDAVVELSLNEITSGKAAGFLAERCGAGTVAVFRGEDSNAPTLIGADCAGIDMIIEAGFGADGSERAESSDRPLSKIELRLAASAFRRICEALHGAASKSAPPTLDRIECLSDGPALVRRDDEWLIARLEFSVLERSGGLFILMPVASAGAFRDCTKDVAPTSTPVDPGWSARMQQELSRTDVTLRAILDEQEFTLEEIASLRPGDMLSLRVTPDSKLKLISHEQPLLWCELGQADGAYMLRVQDFISAEQDLIDVILSE